MSENEDILRMAAEQFLGKSVEEVQDTIIQVTSLFSTVGQTLRYIYDDIDVWLY